MVAVAPGDRVVLQTDDGYVALRVLRGAELVGSWQVHVLALVGRAPTAAGTLELARDGGGVDRLPARLGVVDGALVLQAGHASAPTGGLVSDDGEQRRDDVRGELHLPVRVAALDGHGEEAFHGRVIVGHTLDVSAGGARLDLPGLSATLSEGCRLYLEGELPGGQLAPAVVSVVHHEPSGPVRVRFVDLAPVDRERLVRLVFEAERRLLAERRLRLI
jgi:PilZ domain